MSEQPSTTIHPRITTNETLAAQDFGSIADFNLNYRTNALRSTIHFLCRISPRLAIKLLLFLFLRPRRRPITYLEQLPDGATPIKIFHKLRALKGYVWGNSEKTILLVHGWESHLGHVSPVIKPLLDSGFRVIAFDGPGHGQSPFLYSDMVDFGEAVRNAVEQFGPIHGIIGNSYGGAATALMLSRYADLPLERLVLLSPMVHILQHIDIFNQLIDVPKDIMPHFISGIESRIGTSVDNCNLLWAINRLKLPVYLVHDLDDQIIPVTGSQKLAEQGAHIEFLQTMGLGHRKVIQSQMVIKRIIDFLNTPNPGDSKEELRYSCIG